MLYSFRYESGVCGGISLKPFDEELNSSALTDAGSAYAKSGNAGSDASALVLNGFENNSYRRDYYPAAAAQWESLGLDTSIDTDVTVRDMKNLDDCALIVFAMHGSLYDGEPALVVNEKVTKSTDKAYFKELSSRQIAKVRCTDGYYYWVFDDLFEDNYDSDYFDGSIIFSESCMFFGCDCRSETPDRSFAQTLIGLSAEAVVGYHNSVGADYSRNVMNDLVLGDGVLDVTATGDDDPEPAPDFTAHAAYKALLESYSWIDYAPEKCR